MVPSRNCSTPPFKAFPTGPKVMENMKKRMQKKMGKAKNRLVNMRSSPFESRCFFSLPFWMTLLKNPSR